MADTKIEWADVVWNSFRGCLKVSEGCKNCYAITTAHQLNTRFKNAGNEAARKVAEKYSGLTKVLNNGEKNWTGEVQVDYDTMMQPFKWKKGKRIFVNSMSDVFYEKISVADIAILFAVMFLTPQHTYMILTKRPERMNEVLNSEEFTRNVNFVVSNMKIDLLKQKDVKGWLETTKEILLSNELLPHCKNICSFPFKNIWLGVSVENQATANERIPLLLSTPAHIRFLSMEPLLDAVYLNRISVMMYPDRNMLESSCLHTYNVPYTSFQGDGKPHMILNCTFKNSIDWVIVGGESGSKARPMNPRWVEHIKNCCEGANVPFFFKQWGEYVPVENSVHDEPFFINEKGYGVPMDFEVIPKNKIHQFELSNNYVYKIGKHKAGRLLNGKEYNEFPKTDN